MAAKDRTTAQVNALENTRDSLTGLIYTQRGTNPSYEAMVNWIWHLSQASFHAGLVKLDDANDTTIRIMPGRFTINGTALSYAGEAIDLSAYNNDTAYVWAYDSASTLTIGYGTDAAGWPTVNHVKLAEVVLSGGAITSITDRRAEHIMRVDNADQHIPLMSLRNEDGTVLDATGGAGKWKLVAGGWGTGTLTIETEAVQNTSDNADLAFEFQLPPHYVAGTKVQLIINALYVLASGTTVTHTLDIEVYKLGDDGAVGSDLNQTGEQTLTASAADYTYTIDESGLAAGDRFMGVVRGAISEGDNAGTIKAVIGSIWRVLAAA